MSRRRIPNNLKVISGTDQPCRMQDESAIPSFDLVDRFPDPPIYLNVDGVEMWHDLGNQLTATKILQKPDLYMLEQLCVCWQQMRKKARADMEVSASEHGALVKLFSEFGLSPASRSKVKDGGKEPKEENPFRRKRPKPT